MSIWYHDKGIKKVGKIKPMRFRNENKIFIAFLLMIIVASCIPARQQVNTPASTPASTPTLMVEKPEVTIIPTPESQSAIPDTVLPGVEISFWHAWSGARANQIELIVGRFNEENEWGIQVNAESHADNSVLMEDLDQAFQTGDIPDLVAVEPFALRLFSTQGMPVQDLTQFITSEQWGFSELKFNEIPLVFLKPDQEIGRQIGIPASRTGYVIFYNQSWARELGFSQIPSTIEDFRDQACAAAGANLNDRDVTNNGTGGLFYQNKPETLLSWMRSFGGSVFDNSKQGLVFESNDNRQALEYLYDLYRSDCAWVGRENTPYRYFAERYAIFYNGSLEDIITQTSYNRASGSQDDWVVIPYPSDGVKPTMLVDGYSYGILGEEPQKSLSAWIFIKYLLEAENQIGQVEQYAEFPISIGIMDQVDSFKVDYPAWQQAVQLLPIAENVPSSPEWDIARSLLRDLADQLILFTTDIEEITTMLNSADSIMLEFTHLP